MTDSGEGRRHPRFGPVADSIIARFPNPRRAPGLSLMRKLFRQQAIDAQREKLLGEVSLARPLPLWVFTALAVALAAGLVSFSVWGEYARRERVEGFLALDAGAARLLAPAAGSIAELMVAEGDEVAAGAPIAQLSFEHGTRSGVSGERVEEQFNERIAALAREQQSAAALGSQQADAARRRAADLAAELRQFEDEIRLQQTRIASARAEFQRTDDLFKRGFVSDNALTSRRNEVLDQQVKLEAIKRARAAAERELASARADLPAIDLRTQAQVEQLKRQASELQQGLVQEEAKRESLIRAPVAGVVTNIAVARGESVAPDAPLATLVPKGGGLHAELLVPTRAIGFIKPGDAVVLRYEAFPFQRFGQYRGTVARVSRTVWAPGERLGAMAVKEPVYRVDVKLETQDVAAGGERFPLRAGMLLSADILLEKRSVLEWVFEPVMGLGQRLL